MWQVSITRKDGSPVTSQSEAESVLRSLGNQTIPEAEDPDLGIWLVALPRWAEHNLSTNGTLELFGEAGNLEAEADPDHLEPTPAPEEPEMTEAQMAKIWPVLLGVHSRFADYAVLQYLPGGRSIRNVASYIWDHWMGEPEEVSIDTIEMAIRANLG